MKEKIGKFMGFFLTVFVAATMFAYAACGDDDETARICDPGSTQDCSCGGGRTGYQICDYTGLAWGTCECDCVPNCTGRECGSDGCGGSCGSCSGSEICTPGGVCDTTAPNCPADRDCTGRECGPDPVCGTSCGTCSGSETCNASGRCDCTPNCSGRECGSDGCGGSCGSCSGSETCNASGTCVPGTDPCSSSSSCSACTPRGGCGWCQSTGVCVSGISSGPTSGTCGDWRWTPGDCCTPNCSGRECGSDGCGGSCGSCSGSETCNSSGRCESTVSCGNGRCDSGETCATCPADCGAGDGCLPGSSGPCSNSCGAGTRICDSSCRWGTCVVSSGSATVRVTDATWVYQAYPTVNNCHSAVLWVGVNPTDFRYYYSFFALNTSDLDAIPSGAVATITSANLRLRVRDRLGAAPTLGVYQVTSSYSCAATTYRSMPSFSLPAYATWLANQSSGSWVSVPIVGFIEYVRSAAVVNPTLALGIGTGDIGVVEYIAPGGGGTVDDPTITVTWTCP